MNKLLETLFGTLGHRIRKNCMSIGTCQQTIKLDNR